MFTTQNTHSGATYQNKDSGNSNLKALVSHFLISQKWVVASMIFFFFLHPKCYKTKTIRTIPARETL